MTHTTELKVMSCQQPLRNAALRRNLGTAAIIAIAFSGGPFGLTWLATSSASIFLALLLWRFRQQKLLP
jgi:hypothetical protein